MAFTNLHEAELALEQISNELYSQLKNCTPYTPTEDDYHMVRDNPQGDMLGGDMNAGVRRMAARALANKYGFTDENLMVVARDFIIEARNQADDYCGKLQSIVEAETKKEYSGISGRIKQLRGKTDPTIKAAADESIQERVAERKVAIHSEFDDVLGELYRDTLAFLREVYGKGC
jgi:hypothetical protein